MKIPALLCLSLLAAARAAAGQESGATVSASASATNMDSRSELSFSGAFGYRFSRTIGLELEASWVPTLKSPVPAAGASAAVIQSASFVTASLLAFPNPVFSNPDGRLVIVSNDVRVEIPTTAPALTPYFVAGGGIANINRSADFTLPVPGPLLNPSAIRVTTERVSSSATNLALTLGGGLAVRVSSHVNVDGDLRFFRLLGDQDRNVGRFGAGVRYRF